MLYFAQNLLKAHNGDSVRGVKTALVFRCRANVARLLPSSQNTLYLSWGAKRSVTLQRILQWHLLYQRPAGINLTPLPR